MAMQIHHRDKLLRRLRSVPEIWAKHDWPLDALVVVSGKGRPESAEVQKVTAMHFWLLGIEFTDTAVGLTRSGKLVLMASRKKLQKLNQLEGPGVELLEREKEDAGAAERFVKAIRGVEKLVNVGMLLEQPADGPWATSFAEDLHRMEGVKIREAKDIVSLLLGPKDDEELAHVRQSAKLATMIEIAFVEKVTELLDSETQESNAQVVSQMQAYAEKEEVLDSWACKLGAFDPELFAMEHCSFQSGSRFNLDPKAQANDERVAMEGIYLLSAGVTYHDYSSFIARTMIVAPTLFQKAVYKLILEVQELVIKELQPGVRLADVYKAAANHVRAKSPPIHGELPNKFMSSVGFLMGLEFSDPEVVIHADCQHVVQSGMVFCVSIGFHHPEPPAGVRHPAQQQPWALWVADSVVVASSRADNEVLTSSCTSSPPEIMFDTASDENPEQLPESTAVDEQIAMRTPTKALPTETTSRSEPPSAASASVAPVQPDPPGKAGVATAAEPSKTVEDRPAPLSTEKQLPETVATSSSDAPRGQASASAEPDKEVAEEANAPTKKGGRAATKAKAALKEKAKAKAKSRRGKKDASAVDDSEMELAALNRLTATTDTSAAASSEGAPAAIAEVTSMVPSGTSAKVPPADAAPATADVASAGADATASEALRGPADSCAAVPRRIASKTSMEGNTPKASQPSKPLAGAAAKASTSKRVQEAEPAASDDGPAAKKGRASKRAAGEEAALQQVAKKPAGNLEGTTARSRNSLANQAPQQRESSDQLVLYADGDPRPWFSRPRRHVPPLVKLSCPAQLRKRKFAELQRRFSEEATAAALCEGVASPTPLSDDIASAGTSGSPASLKVAPGSMPTISVDADGHAGKLKLFGINKMEEIEFKSVKKMERDQRGRSHLLRVTFHCTSTEDEATMLPSMVEFRSGTGQNFESIHQKYKDWQKNMLHRDIGGASAEASKASSLTKLKDARSIELLQVGALPQNRSLPVKLEAHRNGFCWTVHGSEGSFVGKQFSVLYSFIDFACYGDGLLYLHVKEPLDICGKALQDVLFRLQDKAKEPEQKGSTVEDSDLDGFKSFCTNVVSLGGLKLERLLLEQQFMGDFPKLGPAGPCRVGFFLCPQALVTLETKPPLCISPADMDIVIIEKNPQSLAPSRQLDLVIISPDYSKRPKRISNIENDEFQGIALWLNEREVVWYTCQERANWWDLCKRINRHPSNFLAKGGWDDRFEDLEEERAAILDGELDKHAEVEEPEVNADDDEGEEEDEDESEEDEDVD